MVFLPVLKHFCETYMKRADREHACDGVIFTPVEDPVHFGTHRLLFKAKPGADRTCDFLVRPVSANSKRQWDQSFCPVSQSLYDDTLSLNRIAELYFVVNALELFTVLVWPDDTPRPDCLLGKATSSMWEFKQSADGLSWTPVRPREDKKSPNHISTVIETLQSIRDNVTLEELYID
jgi:hypothetical protein